MYTPDMPHPPAQADPHSGLEWGGRSGNNTGCLVHQELLAGSIVPVGSLNCSGCGPQLQELQAQQVAPEGCLNEGGCSLQLHEPLPGGCASVEGLRFDCHHTQRLPSLPAQQASDSCLDDNCCTLHMLQNSAFSAVLCVLAPQSCSHEARVCLQMNLGCLSRCSTSYSHQCTAGNICSEQIKQHVITYVCHCLACAVWVQIIPDALSCVANLA